MNYENYLIQQLNTVKTSLGKSEELYITTEQAFFKLKDKKPNSIYFIIKYLSSKKSYGTEITPIQIIALSEQNQMEDTRDILNAFGSNNNFGVIVDGTTRIKQEYSTPVVLSNFNEVDYGYRSVIYITGTLYKLYGIADITDFTIDNVVINTLGTNLSYSMTGNTQPVGSSYIASTVKNVSTFALSMTLPSITTDYGTLITKIMNIASGTSNDSAFSVSFTINGVAFAYSMRLTSMQFTTAPNEIPSIQVGLTV